MNQTVNQQIQRPQGIGGSDVAALLGLSPFKSPVQLWAEKVGHPGATPLEGMHLRLGQHLEPFVAKEYEMATGLVAQIHQAPIFHREHRYFFAHVDRLVQSNPNTDHWVDGITRADTVLECKTASVFNKGEWGESLSDQVPTHYLLQCAWYMALTHCMQADVAVLIGNQDFRIFRVHRNFELESAILAHAQRFWQECVLAGIPPAPMSPLDANLLYPVSKSGVRLQASSETVQAIDRLRAIQGQIKLFEQEMEVLKSSVMSSMGESEELVLGEQVIATWKSTNPAKRLDTQALKAAYPEIAKEYTLETSPTRRFVVKEAA
jgi:putative phage-type endonuclease